MDVEVHWRLEGKTVVRDTKSTEAAMDFIYKGLESLTGDREVEMLGARVVLDNDSTNGP